MAFKDSLKLYYQLTKPGIIYGNLITALAGFLFAAKGNINWSQLLYMACGLALVIGSACTFNNVMDRDLDKKMARTKKRGLVTGQINPHSALFFASLLGVVGVVILAVQVNLLSAALGLAAEVWYVLIYGYAKRSSIHGALVGSVPGATPPVIGYVAVSGRLTGGALILFLILAFWQMPHFFGIALYRKKDYAAAGVPVMPLAVGDRNTKIQSLGYIVGFIVCVAALTIFNYSGPTYLLVVGAAGLYWLWLAVKNFNLPAPQWGKKIFLSSLAVNLIFATMTAANWWVEKI